MLKYLWLRRICAIPMLLLIPYATLLEWLDHKYQCKKQDIKKPFAWRYEMQSYWDSWRDNWDA